GHLCWAGPRDLGCYLFPTCPSPVPPVTWPSYPSVSLVLVASATSTFHMSLRWAQALVLPISPANLGPHLPRTDSMGRRPSCQTVPAGHTPTPTRPSSLKGRLPMGPLSSS
uniref:Uncharacterized protein n=1 Tax=Saimiri boliviensis boliviensis TaxID=39432 RepID=A0A2K6TXQ6_SAIBB